MNCKFDLMNFLALFRRKDHFWESNTIKPRKKEQTFLKTDRLILINEVLMTFSGCGSYHKDSIQYICVKYT